MSESTLLVRTGTHVGLVHHTNEDSLAVFPMPPSCELLAVCDGMGGMGRGDEASAIAVEVLQERLSKGDGFAPERIERAIQEADVEIRRRLAVPGNTPGSTAVVVAVDQGLAHVVWAGDSRAYWIRGHAVLERTRDHKLVNELVDAGELTEAEAKLSALAHVVTKALGGRGPGEPPIVPQRIQHPWKLQTKDVLLLCSDGLCDLADDDEIADTACQDDLDKAIRDLTQIALDRGGHDNITIVVARWDGESFDDEAHETPVISSPRTLTPTPAPSAAGRDVTWDDIDPNLANGADVEDPEPSTEDSPIQPPPPRASTEEEQPRTGLAIGIAVVAVVFIVIAFLASQGLFG